MSMRELLLILISVSLSAVAQIAFKFGVSSEAGLRETALLGPLAKLLTPGVFVGLTCYAVGTLLWLTALSKIELSQAYPFVGLGFVLTTLAGWWLFDDQLSAQRLTGVALVIGGVVLVAKT